MLLTLREDADVAQEEFTPQDLLRYGKSRHRRAQYLAQQFWTRWRQEYLHTLTQRHKWKTRVPCISIGDVVLVRDKTAARNQWPMGLVSDVKTSKDGLVRSVTVKLASKTKEKSRYFSRPISELVLFGPSSLHQCESATPM